MIISVRVSFTLPLMIGAVFKLQMPTCSAVQQLQDIEEAARKARMGATHFLMKTLPRVATEMALHVLAYNLTRVMNIMGVRPLLAAMRA